MDYTCSCPTGFSGDICESPIPTEPTVATLDTTTSEEQSTGEDGQSEGITVAATLEMFRNCSGLHIAVRFSFQLYPCQCFT